MKPEMIPVTLAGHDGCEAQLGFCGRRKMGRSSNGILQWRLKDNLFERINLGSFLVFDFAVGVRRNNRKAFDALFPNQLAREIFY